MLGIAVALLLAEVYTPALDAPATTTGAFVPTTAIAVLLRPSATVHGSDLDEDGRL